MKRRANEQKKHTDKHKIRTKTKNLVIMRQTKTDTFRDNKERTGKSHETAHMNET